MNAARWQRVAEIYESARGRPPHERDSFLREACAGDEELRLELESLLRQPVTGAGVLEDVAEEARQYNPMAAPPSAVPDIMGRYRVLEVIAEGGMGTVFAAQQEHPQRLVALKVVRAGLTDPELIRRFERESQALGRLQHPGVAQIYEAGVDGGRPFFAMEFIRGVRITEYVKRHECTTRERLELMVKLCDAVHHAHQRGIVHRDLKPANILVDESGQPKVLDFGVAHITDTDAPATARTSVGELVGTVAYMSPEQVLGESSELDARSDVYALGVLLYELLAGRLPYEIGRHIHEAARIIREAEPVPLGRIHRAFRGDLETIARKAMEKSKLRRYATAADLAADLRCYLADRPIHARPPSVGYQARKLALRHKGWSIGAAVVLMVVTAAAIVSAREAVRANAAGRAAVQERDRTARAERSALAERDRALRAEATATEERNRAVQEKRRADVEAATAKAVNDFLQNDLLAQAGARAQASAKGKPDPNLTVRAALDRAAARIAGKFDSQPLVEAGIRHTLGNTYWELGLYPASQEQLERAVELLRRAAGPEHPETLSAAFDLASVYHEEGKYAAARPIFEKILAERQRVLGSRAPETLLVIRALANGALVQGRQADAERLMLRALAAAPAKDDYDTLAMRSALGVAYSNQGKYAEAERAYQAVLAGRRRLLGDEHPATLNSIDNLAVAQRYLGKYQEAEANLTGVLAIRRRILPADHPDTLAGMNSLAMVYKAQGRHSDAEAMLNSVLEGRKRVLGQKHLYTLRTMHNLAELYAREGRAEDAEAMFRAVLEIRRRELGDAHVETVITVASLGSLALERGRYQEAETFLREAIAGFEKAMAGTWRHFQAQSMLGASLAATGSYAAAEPLLLTGYKGMVATRSFIPFENRGDLEQARDAITRLYDSWGKPEEAAAWRSRGSNSYSPSAVSR